jgi:hypothetical protein
MRVVINSREVVDAMGRCATAIEPSRDWLLRWLAAQVETRATELASGPASAEPGSYPIPVRTGRFRRDFVIDIRPPRAVVANQAQYARALHEGFRPYGNPSATPIPARPYFSDALDGLDLDEAHRRWSERLFGADDWAARLRGDA